MEHLLGPTRTLVLAALLLVIVGSLPAVAAPSKLKTPALALAYALALFAGVALVWFGFDRGAVMPDTFASSIERYAVDELSKAKEPNVVMIDGGSYVLNAVDTGVVMSELTALGYSARVVRFAAGAANHFERYRIQQGIVQRLHGKQAADQRWFYLAEVQFGYDQIPLAQFDNNLDTWRAIQYCTPANSWQAARALGSPGVTAPLGGAWRWQLLRHTLINAFSAGALKRYAPEADIALGGGAVTPHRPGKFRFRGFGAQVAALRKPTDPANVSVLPWLRDIRERRSQRLWRPFRAELIYFGVPSTSVGQLEYVRGFCQAVGTKCIAPADAALLGELDNPKLWRDVSHMTNAGADIYSRWLAHQLVALRVLKR